MVRGCNRFHKLSEDKEVDDNSIANKKIIPYEQLIQKIKDYKEKEEMHNTEQMTYEALEAMIEELIKELNKKIEKE